MKAAPASIVAWRTSKRWLEHLEDRKEVLRIKRPVDVQFEAGAIADLLVKNDGPAVVFEQPRLPDGTISDIPLAMNLFGNQDRTMRALGATHETEIGDRMVAMMKPDIGLYMRKPWKALPLLRDALAMPPKKKRKGNSQRVRLPTDLTRLPIPTTWPKDGGPFVTLPLVVTKNPKNGEHNLGMYRAQVFGPKEIGLHWQIHKHGAEHAEAAKASGKEVRMPVAICMGGPPELIFSAISPLPDNLSEYQFAGILGRKSLPITKALTQDLMVPAEADIVIEGYCIPGETRLEGPFGDHFGFYSLTGQYPVMHVTAITCRKDAVLAATIVGLPPMEDGHLGEAIGRQFSPVLNFQHRDVNSVHLPMETGFHNLAIVASKQRYPRQGRKTAIGLLGAGQMMFLKTMIAVDPDQNPKDLEQLLDALNDKVDIKTDVIRGSRTARSNARCGHAGKGTIVERIVERWSVCSCRINSRQVGEGRKECTRAFDKGSDSCVWNEARNWCICISTTRVGDFDVGVVGSRVRGVTVKVCVCSNLLSDSNSTRVRLCRGDVTCCGA